MGETRLPIHDRGLKTVAHKTLQAIRRSGGYSIAGFLAALDSASDALSFGYQGMAIRSLDWVVRAVLQFLPLQISWQSPVDNGHRAPFSILSLLVYSY
jgi:hypothetical protein